MTEVIEQQLARDLPLASTHRALGANFIEEDGWLLPATYGNSQLEYSSIREAGTGLIDLSSRGRIRVSGSEALMFLNGLITNDMKTLGDNRWMPAVFPNVQGRFIAAMRIAKLGSSYLLDTEAVTHQKILKLIGRFILAGDFRVSDETFNTVQLSLQGKTAAAILEKRLEPSVSAIPINGAQELTWHDANVIVVRSSHTGEDGFDLIVTSDAAAELWTALTQAGAVPVGHDVLEVLRIEAGIPRYGRDMDESNVVTETNLDDAVSFTKGCYIGQEIIIRIKHRGHVAKKMSGLLLQGKSTPESGAVVSSDEEKEIGRVTSSAFSPKLDAVVALAYVRYEHTAAGTSVRVTSPQDSFSGEVHSLPFLSN